jgi:hypothetical protein
MDKEFISYAQSKSLKELGFNEPCLAITGITKTLKSLSLYLHTVIMLWMAMLKHHYTNKHSRGSMMFINMM